MSGILNMFLLMEYDRRSYDPDHDGEADKINDPDADEQHVSDSQIDDIDFNNGFNLDDNTETSS